MATGVNRVTGEEVQALLAPGKDYRKGDNLIPFIASAHTLADKLNDLVNEFDLMISEPELKQIEGYLACHFYLVSMRQVQQKTIGRTTNTYAGQAGKGFAATTYGQAAISLDTSGILADISTGDLYKNTAQIEWLGCEHHPEHWQ